LTSKAKKGCFFSAFSGIILFFSGVLSFWIVSIATPEDSPRARMFRTEADLRALKTAVETYHTDHHAYPPSGAKGLDMANAYLSRNVQYHAGGAPADGWGNRFQYVPAREYDTEGSVALRDEDGDFFAQDSYQLYSPGMDGDPGFEETLKQRDNIVSWDADRSWRPVYSERQKKFFMERGRKQ
jgi:hypothetical protein